MFNFGLEITSVLSGTICPVQVAQYDRYIQELRLRNLNCLRIPIYGYSVAIAQELFCSNTISLKMKWLEMILI